MAPIVELTAVSRMASDSSTRDIRLMPLAQASERSSSFLDDAAAHSGLLRVATPSPLADDPSFLTKLDLCDDGLTNAPRVRDEAPAMRPPLEAMLITEPVARQQPMARSVVIVVLLGLVAGAITATVIFQDEVSQIIGAWH